MVKEEVSEVPKGPVEPTGYIVNSVKNEEGKWVHTDLAELTGLQFVEWVKTVYPFHEDLMPEKFNTRSSKMRTVQNIIEFHETSLLTARRQNSKEYNH